MSRKRKRHKPVIPSLRSGPIAYDDKLRAFLRTIHPTGRYAIYVIGPKEEIVGFARAYTNEADHPTGPISS